jgi:hypothetical protein
MHASAGIGLSIHTQHICEYLFRIITEDLSLMILKIGVINRKKNNFQPLAMKKSAFQPRILNCKTV